MTIWDSKRRKIFKSSKSFSLLTLATVLTACGPLANSTSDFKNSHLANEHSLSDLLKRGRQTSFTQESAVEFGADSKFHPALAEYSRDGANEIASFTSFNTTLMPALARPSIEKALMDLVDDNPDVYGVSSKDLRLAASGLIDNGRHSTITFNRFVSDIPVEGAHITFALSRHQNIWRLRDVINRSFGQIVTPALTSNDMQIDYGSFLTSSFELLEESDIILPRLIAGRYKFANAKVAIVRDSTSGQNLRLIVDKNSGQLLQASSEKKTFNSQLKARVLKRAGFYANQTIEVPLSGIDIDQIKTDSEGRISDVQGRQQVYLANNVALVYQSGAQIAEDAVITIDRDGPVVLTEQQIDLPALNAFVQINRVVDFVGDYLNDAEVPWLAERIEVQVNSTEAECNAYYSDAIVMMAAGSECTNTALINDVLYHEWGHGLDDHTGPSQSMADGAFSEGIGDIVSAYMTGDHNLSPGFFHGREAGLRDLAKVSRFPEDRGKVHDEGLIIGGAFFEMRRLLIERYGQSQGARTAERLFFRHLLETDYYLNSYRSVLRLDDDDSNPATPSPNRCLINKAFAKHGLARGLDCQDKNIRSSREDKTIQLALSQRRNGETYLGVAIVGEGHPSVCLGAQVECLQGTPSELSMSKLRTVDQRQIFDTDEPLRLQQTQSVTVVVERSGTITYRTFEVSAR